MSDFPRLGRIEIRPLPDGHTLLVTPTRRIFRVQASAASVAEILRRCDGQLTLDEVANTTSDPPAWEKVLRTLQEERALRADSMSDDGQDWVRFDYARWPERLETTTVLAFGDCSLLKVLLRSVVPAALRLQVTSRERAIASTRRRNPHDLVLLSVRDRFDYEDLISLNDLGDQTGVRWSQFHVEQGRGWIGPAVIPGKTPDYRDLLGRRLAAAEDRAVFRALMSPPFFGARHMPPEPELVWMLSLLVVDITRWVAGAPCRSFLHEVEVDPVSLSVSAHPILPLPDRSLDRTEMVDSLSINIGTSLLVDERTGLITHVQHCEHTESIPQSLETVQVHVSDMNRLYPWANNQICGGSVFGSYTQARLAAIGEGLERYCGNWVPISKVIEASYKELIARGEHAIDPERLILYSERQYDTPGFPFVRFDRDRRVQWVLGRSLTRDCPAWVPGSLVYVNWYRGPFCEQEQTNFLYYPGIAAGTDLESALSAALGEIIERDATMIWWLNAQPLPAVVMTPSLAALWQGEPARRGQRAWLFHLDNEFDVPVMAGVVENVEERLINIGFGVRPDPEEAAFKAFTEALTLQEGSRDLLKKDSLFSQAVARGLLSAAFHKPWRRDRRYLDDFQPDFSDVADLMVQQQVFLDPRARERIAAWVDREPLLSWTDLPCLPDGSIETYRKRIESRGYEIFYVDVTTADVAITGIRVVRGLVPGLVPNSPAAFPFLGKQRVRQEPVRLGWRSTPLDEHDLNYFPMPHA